MSFPPIIETISEHYKYWEGYIAYADIQLSGLPDEIEANNQKLFKKNEFHISLINAAGIASLIDSTSPGDIETGIIKEFLDFIEGSSLDEFKILHKFRYAIKDERKTVIVMCEVPGADKFFERLSKKYGKELPLQPFHITLYTLEGGRGIGILSDEMLGEITEQIDLPGLKNLKAVK